MINNSNNNDNRHTHHNHRYNSIRALVPGGAGRALLPTDAVHHRAHGGPASNTNSNHTNSNNSNSSNSSSNCNSNNCSACVRVRACVCAAYAQVHMGGAHTSAARAHERGTRTHERGVLSFVSRGGAEALVTLVASTWRQVQAALLPRAYSAYLFRILW